jgi:hypothetical protein
LLEHFNVRSGYAKPAETFDENTMEQAFRADLSITAE